MKVTIAHIYPKELCLYGENGNIKALKYALQNKDIDVDIININEGDKIEFQDYDFIFVGSGRKQYLDKMQELLEPYKKEFLKFIKDGKVMLVTGNAISLFTFLGMYEVEYYKDRIVSDVVATTSICPENIYGFQNTEYLIKSTNHILFNMNQGFGNNGTLMEGFNENNFYATSIIGPILARNDNLTKYIVNVLIENKRE